MKFLFLLFYNMAPSLFTKHHLFDPVILYLLSLLSTLINNVKYVCISNMVHCRGETTFFSSRNHVIFSLLQHVIRSNKGHTIVL